MLQWICQGHNGNEMNHTLAGIPSLPSRLQELTMRFQAKLISLHTDNPIRSLQTALKTSPSPAKLHRKLLFSLLSPIPLLSNYLQLSNSRPPWDPLTFTDYIRDCKLSYSISRSILPRSILPSARDKALFDISLRIRNPEYNRLQFDGD